MLGCHPAPETPHGASQRLNRGCFLPLPLSLFSVPQFLSLLFFVDSGAIWKLLRNFFSFWFGCGILESLQKGRHDMKPAYYVLSPDRSTQFTANIRPAVQSDFMKTEQKNWQTSWMTDFIQDTALEKYALEIIGTGELVGLGAYRNMPEGVAVYVEYIESAPGSNPTLTKDRKYVGIGAVLLAFGIQLSIDYGYGGAIYLKAKTSEIREHYIHDFGAIPFSRHDPFLLLIDGNAAWELFSQYLAKED